MNETRERIERILRDGLAPERLEVADESAAHAGHRGARGGGGHYRVKVVSAAFTGRSLMERHRMIYRLLAEEMGSTVHALALEARAPGEG